MANEIIGRIKCPHCDNPSATVHAQKRGGKLYYRCYQSAGSVDPLCGTVQITGPKGQQWIKSNMRTEGGEPKELKAETVNAKGSEPEEKENKSAKGSELKKKPFFSKFLADDEE